MSALEQFPGFKTPPTQGDLPQIQDPAREQPDREEYEERGEDRPWDDWNNMSKHDQFQFQSRGGIARAKSLTKDERKGIAARAAAARWNLPRADWEADLNIGPITMRCAVVMIDNKPVRVVSETEFMRALKMYRSGALSVRRDTGESGAQIPLSLAYKNLKPYIEKHLGDVHFQPMKVVYKGGNVGHGITAEIVPKICEIWMDAKKDGVLGARQTRIAEMAEILLRGLAHVGIIALIDEATGFQHERAKNALAEILEEFIAKELRAWTSTFPVEFYEHIF